MSTEEICLKSYINHISYLLRVVHLDNRHLTVIISSQYSLFFCKFVTMLSSCIVVCEKTLNTDAFKNFALFCWNKIFLYTVYGLVWYEDQYLSFWALVHSSESVALRPYELHPEVFLEVSALSAAICKLNPCSMTAYIHGVTRGHNNSTAHIFSGWFNWSCVVLYSASSPPGWMKTPPPHFYLLSLRHQRWHPLPVFNP